MLIPSGAYFLTVLICGANASLTIAVDKQIDYWVLLFYKC